MKLAFHSLSWELPVRCAGRWEQQNVPMGIAKVPWGAELPGRTTVLEGVSTCVRGGRWMRREVSRGRWVAQNLKKMNN